jgi:hypothetical protein
MALKNIKNDINGINLAYPAKAVFEIGEAVQLASDGEFERATAGAGTTVGYVYVPPKAVGEDCTVISKFRMVTYATASGSITTGARVKNQATIPSPASGYAYYQAIGGSTYADGICLSGGADGSTVLIGLF